MLYTLLVKNVILPLSTMILKRKVFKVIRFERLIYHICRIKLDHHWYSSKLKKGPFGLTGLRSTAQNNSYIQNTWSVMVVHEMICMFSVIIFLKILLPREWQPKIEFSLSIQKAPTQWFCKSNGIYSMLNLKCKHEQSFQY